ncbi:bacterio-opsin activator domain-containing protein [Halosolutus amylolyticus]|uniref:Bacterio-opsin activator domain-containing protein n=1 Tax=Halosolutus amylolyticus TaxID=2932267 RepID=A0ABD5PPM8_9EURY|nr:bacterio-opsin activator domain-containing protein [Halosolutus amylolyticus]
MAGTNRDDWIVVITGSDERRRQLESALRDETSMTVTALAPDADFESRLDSPPDDPDRDPTDRSPSREGGAATSVDPAGVVVSIDRPAALRTTLERVHEVAPSPPTIVAPRNGSERVATAALRAGATEYVPAESDTETLDRIVATIRSERDADRESDVEPESTDEWRVLRSLADELPDEAFIIDEDGTYLDVSVRRQASELCTLSRDELVGRNVDEAFSSPTAARLQSCIDRTIRAGEAQSIEYDVDTSDGRRCYEAQVVPIVDEISESGAVLWLAQDVTERARRVRELQSRRDRLETLNRINAVIREVIETLVEAPSRDAIEREVCDQLVDSELYCGSWIAERTADRQLAYRTGSGSANAVLETARELPADRQPSVQRALVTGDVQTANGLSETDELADPLREAAAEDNVASLIAVPISHEDATYGVLTVLASRDDAFSEREQAEFRLLGETIGFAIQAVKNRQLLFADTVVELEFHIHGGDTLSFDLSESYDCTCSLEWAGTTADGRSFQFVTIEGLDGQTVLEEATDHDSVESCRLIHDGTRRCTIELRLSRSGVRTLANHGATIRNVTVEDGVGSILVEVSRDADVREIAEALTAVYENTDLVARREVDRPVRTAAERRTRILDELTDRQLTTLRLAYYSGFFDWPRESTGEEIAEAMDVSPPTMHQHLRKGLKTVLGEFFEDGSGTE